MDFWYYIHPQLLEDGAYSEFPDHYYVEVSYDNGEFWSELWDARWDMGSADDVRQASLFLDQPADENTLVRFRAVSAEEEGLYYLWAIDDVAFRAQTDVSYIRYISHISHITCQKIGHGADCNATCRQSLL